MSEQATLRLHFQITIMGPLVNLNAIFFLSELTCNLYWHMKMGVLFLPIIMLFWSLELQCLCSVRSWSGQVFWTWIYYHLLVFRLWQPQVRDRLSSVCVSILKRQHHQWETPGPAGCSNIYLCKRKYALWLCAIFKKLSCFSFQFSQTEELNKVCILNFMIIWWQRNQTSAFSGVRILAFGAGFFFFSVAVFFPSSVSLYFFSDHVDTFLLWLYLSVFPPPPFSRSLSKHFFNQHMRSWKNII